MYTTLFPYVFGAILAYLMVRPERRVSRLGELRFLRSFMVGVAVAFIGFPLSSGDLTGAGYELAALVACLLLLAGTRGTMALLAVTYFVHGLWDLAFLAGWVPVDKPAWICEICVPFDWLIAAYVAYLVWRPAGERAAAEA